jgi:hypothetical protein
MSPTAFRAHDLRTTHSRAALILSWETRTTAPARTRRHFTRAIAGTFFSLPRARLAQAWGLFPYYRPAAPYHDRYAQTPVGRIPEDALLRFLACRSGESTRRRLPSTVLPDGRPAQSLTGGRPVAAYATTGRRAHWRRAA